MILAAPSVRSTGVREQVPKPDKIQEQQKPVNSTHEEITNKLHILLSLRPCFRYVELYTYGNDKAGNDKPGNDKPDNIPMVTTVSLPGNICSTAQSFYMWAFSFTLHGYKMYIVI